MNALTSLFLMALNVTFNENNLISRIWASVSTLFLSSPSELTGTDKTSCFFIPQIKKSRGKRPGDRAGHGKGTQRPIHFGCYSVILFYYRNALILIFFSYNNPRKDLLCKMHVSYKA